MGLVQELNQIKDTDKFRQAAIHFDKYGYYTSAPRGTTAYKAYWDREKDRCLNGFIAEDGDRITGYNYFYLNYCVILRVVEVEHTLPNGSVVKKQDRIQAFPKYYDFDKAYFDAVELAETSGKHLAVLKARGKGYSFKSASMLCRNYFLIRKSISYAIASEKEFLIKDGLLTKAWDMMSFIDEKTAWSKKRQKKDQDLHRRASLVVKSNGTEVELGYKSEIIGVTLNNDPQKARGKRGKLILFEEAGKFPDIKTAWQVARPSVESGSAVFGLMIAYGTGGTEEADYEGLKDIFYEPNAYNCLAFDNVWDEGNLGGKCGFFVPEYANLDGKDEQGRSFMDKDGNSNIDITKEYVIKERQIVIDNASDRSTIDRHVAEKPLTPEEATLNISSNIFPKRELIRQLAFIRNNNKLRNFKQVGNLIFDTNGKIIWEQRSDLKDLVKYRLSKGDDHRGATVIWEHPLDNPPYGLYIAGCDPYDMDTAQTSDSLGSVFIYKRFQDFESYHDLVVAEYTGRPDSADEFYENIRKLLLYYNAKLLYENEKKGLFSYFSHLHSEHLLADQPNIISDIISDSRVQRGKGIHMTKSIKSWGELRIRDWLNEEYEPGKKNLTKLLSEPLLEELIAYNDKGNFDRVMAFMMVMIYREELHHVKVRNIEDDIKSRYLFPANVFSDLISGYKTAIDL